MDIQELVQSIQNDARQGAFNTEEILLLCQKTQKQNEEIRLICKKTKEQINSMKEIHAVMADVYL